MLRSVVLWLCAASASAAGLKRAAQGGGSFYLPGPCSEDELDAGTCKEDAVLCSDEMWNKCGNQACANELRAELCARKSGEVCVQRMGVQSYDRDAQAAQREEAEAEEAEANPVAETSCMSMTAESQDDWCTMVSATGFAS